MLETAVYLKGVKGKCLEQKAYHIVKVKAACHTTTVISEQRM
jgi:hypothetical protein